MAVDGFWIVQFEGIGGGGGGVAVLTKGQVFGGDSAYTYSGTYQTAEPVFKARVAVKNFLPGIPNVLGVVGDFELSLAGTVERNDHKREGDARWPTRCRYPGSAYEKRRATLAHFFTGSIFCSCSVKAGNVSSKVAIGNLRFPSRTSRNFFRIACCSSSISPQSLGLYAFRFMVTLSKW